MHRHSNKERRKHRKNVRLQEADENFQQRHEKQEGDGHRCDEQRVHAEYQSIKSPYHKGTREHVCKQTNGERKRLDEQAENFNDKHQNSNG